MNSFAFGWFLPQNFRFLSSGHKWTRLFLEGILLSILLWKEGVVITHKSVSNRFTNTFLKYLLFDWLKYTIEYENIANNSPVFNFHLTAKHFIPPYFQLSYLLFFPEYYSFLTSILCSRCVECVALIKPIFLPNRFTRWFATRYH